MTLENGTKLGRYEIRSKTGEGGMGEVYLAQDTKLGRKVALKILPAEVATHPDRMKRFVQEAKTASALNHPNIITIYEIEQIDSVNLIATEFIDGETLRKHIRNTPLKLADMLDLAAQIAGALSAAHAAGIVHRDIKPENIMLRRDGIVKVLDFGLAKLSERADTGTVDTEAATKGLVQTEPGVVVGTAAYMSPEQARGLLVDARTDIFSLGVVIYEMVAGRAPFGGATRSDLIVALLERDPPPLARFTPEAPAELERIVSKALTKDREERYQTAKDLLIDLRRLRQQLEVKAEVERLATPGSGSEVAAATDAKQAAVATTGEAPTRTQAEKVGRTSSAEYIVAEIQKHKKAFGVIASLALTAILVIAGLVIYGHRSQPLTEKDTILLADFVNTTGDEVFDGALKQGLAVQLEQSPFLNIFPEERVQQTLQSMRRSLDQRVTRDVAREICERQGLKAMIVGSIALLGSHYVITLEAVNAQTSDVLARAQSEAESKDRVLGALGKAATGLREKLGESLSTIQKFDAPIEATTSSLEALKDYSMATELNAKGKRLEAISLLKRAVELDPQFAYGYSVLSVFSTNIGQREAARAYGTRAFELRERASEPERLWIIAQYYTLVTGELEKGIETLELLKQTYPRRHYVRNALTYSHSLLGQHEKAVEEMQEEVRLDPNNPQFCRNLARQLRYLKRFQEARAVLERASAQNPDAPALRLEGYVNAFLQGDAGEMQSQMEWFRAKPDETLSFGLQTAVAEVAGQYRKARQFRAQWVDVSQRLNKEAAAGNAAGDAQMDALYGHCELVRAEASRSLAIARSPSALQTVALALALCGELGQAQSLADEYAKLMPTDTLANGVDLPVIRAAIANNRGNYAQAIELLGTARRYDHSELFKVPLDLDQFAPYLRGQAFLGQRSGTEAAAEFQYLLDHRSLAPFSLLGPLAQLGLARAYALQSDSEKAHKAYDVFFALWKDADADLPVLIEAKKEYETLK